ncbi:hypothetical protein [Xanthocytophaga agilis]|uniref:Uncharacterized protein n=1 Tax=Xanthocytophaga agilis TaxID=3048010 RepID=A0AAE3R4F9_9BACT|nr:hypothetical protein [Xanthocytophaga agilis]MDJ1500497.1 hypothetical protein [Xanthocytophaga agilis]
MKGKRILIIGKQGSGKTAVAEHFSQFAKKRVFVESKDLSDIIITSETDYLIFDGVPNIDALLKTLFCRFLRSKDIPLSPLLSQVVNFSGTIILTMQTTKEALKGWDALANFTVLEIIDLGPFFKG